MSEKRMTLEERNAFFREKFETEICKIMQAKGKDYGGTKTANSNFDRAAANLDLTKYQVWAVYFSKHLDSMFTFLREGQLESEPIDGRLTDLITYLLILWSMIEEERMSSTSTDGSISGTTRSSPGSSSG